MRLLLASVLAALVVPCCALAADVRVTAFYYPWYGTAAADGAYLHWSQDGHVPPDDIASSFYPLGGPYSSDAHAVVHRQMVEAKRAGIVASLPVGHVGTVDEVASAALFLATDESSYIAGVELVIDGGLSQV